MKNSNHNSIRRLALLCCGMLVAMAMSSAAQVKSGAGQQTGAVVVSEAARVQAEQAYVDGARALSEGKAEAAEKHFARAQALNPTRAEYGVAVTIAREHRVTALVQAAAQANRRGKKVEAEKLLGEAAAIDPENEMVKQHEATGVLPKGVKGAAAKAEAVRFEVENMDSAAEVLSRGEVVPAANNFINAEGVSYAGPIHLKFNDRKQSFHISGNSRQLIPQVLQAYGVKTVMDDSAGSRMVRLDVDEMSAAEIVPILDMITKTFIVPLDEHTAIVGADTAEGHSKLDPQLLETVYLPGLSEEDMKSVLAVASTVFGIKQATLQAGAQTLTVRASEGTLKALNAMLEELMDNDSEVLLDVSLYEVDTTRSQQTGAQLPQQLTAFNFDSEIQQVVQANQSTINQAISSGLIQQGNYLQYAELLLGAGLLNSTVFGQSFVLFGNGLTRTGLSGVGGTLDMALNTSEARMIDETHVLAKNRDAGTFRAGERYPIITSTFSNVSAAGTSGASLSGLTASQLALLGLSSASALSTAAAATIPQIQYEDLGLTLKTTPTIQRNGVMTLHFDLKLEALAGSSSNGIPVLNNRAFSGDVTVADGQNAVIVSTLTKEEVGALSGTPGLDELPGFNDIESRSSNGTGQELVLVVQPHLVRRVENILAGPMVMLAEHPQGGIEP